jgi:DNA-binding HxlR family transcriptional regulator
MATTQATDRPDSSDATADDPEDDVVTRVRDDVPAQLRLLDDAYAREILAALADTPMRGRDLIERCEASRATVYRRLDRLQSAGFVTAEATVDPNGHHCRTFRLVRSDLTVRVEDGGITVVARPASA